MRLNAFDFHMQLTDEQRHAVSDWLASVFGDDWQQLRLWRYEVTGEGTVRFHRFDYARSGVSLTEWEQRTDTPPPVFAQ